MELPKELVGTTTSPVEFSWSSRDIMLYALAVGAGSSDPTTELTFTTENTDGVEIAVLPTFATLMTRSAPWPDLGDDIVARLVHGRQRIERHRPIPVEGKATVTAQVVAVVPRSTGSLLVIEATAVDSVTDEPLATGTSSLFLRGVESTPEGDPPAEDPTVPERPADLVVTSQSRPEQALLYRLTGDRHRLHSDPGYAARAGFDRPILHGLCTFGVAGRAVVQSVTGGDAQAVRAISARFTAPVFPGDELTTEMWASGAHVQFRTRNQHGVNVLDRGAAEVVPTPRVQQ